MLRPTATAPHLDSTAVLQRLRKRLRVVDDRMRAEFQAPGLRLGPRRGGDHVVFDTYAAEGLEFLDHRPVDMGAP